ncbi:MAG TPA: hypothetical protein VG269_04925 [Tepidisphaeraceae bacterium]|jgi:hypothetical protein|nr:hypothetical protein [Tepidisphaeraceae bacterium]
MLQTASPTPATPRAKVTMRGNNTSVVTYGIAEFIRPYPLLRGLFAFASIVVGALVIYALCKPMTFGIFTAIGIPLTTWLMYIAVISGSDFILVFPDREAMEARAQAEVKFGNSNSPEDALKLDLSRLNEYYVINQSQARTSFRWAILAMFVGFGTIITGVWIFYAKASVPDKFMTGISTAAGCVVNVVSAFFLYLHSKTQQRSIYYFDQLSRLQKLFIAIRLADLHDDAQAKKEARNVVIHSLVEGDQKGVTGTKR